MNINLTIPERLKDLRTERGLTLEQLSEATGISRAALGKYEADDFKDITPEDITGPRDGGTDGTRGPGGRG